MLKLSYLTCCIVVLSLILTGMTRAELVGWWKLDEISGTIASDSSGNGYNGTVTGDPQWVDGSIRGALLFNGDDSVILPGDGMGMTSEVGSVVFWFNYPDATLSDIKTLWWGGDSTAGNGMGPDNEMHVHIEQAGDNVWLGGEICFRLLHSPLVHLHSDPEKGGADSPGNSPVNPILINDGEWHLFVGIWGDADGNASMYLDTELIQQAEYSPISYPLTYMFLGQMGAGNRTYDGTLDDVKVYNHALSEEDIHNLTVEDVDQAWKLRPGNGEMEVHLDTKLMWNAGLIDRETGELYGEHHLYMGTDFNDVNSATVPMEILTDVNEYDPVLEYDTMYFWRIDEFSSLDPNSPVKGNVTSFTTRNFIVVEDFESYDDFPPNEVFMTWADGWDIPENGATSGHPAPDFVGGEHYMEDDIVHGGLFSLPFYYDNSVGMSEITRDLDASMRDWTKDDVITLTLFYYGDASNDAEPMYVALNGNAVVTNDDPLAARDNEWNQWDISLQEFADQGVVLSNVSSMSIGFGNKANPTAGGEGRVFFDDIRLYRSAPEDVEPEPEPVDPGTANLVAYYDFENDVQDNSGRGQHGTAMNDPIFIDGPAGYGRALRFDGLNDYVELPIGSAIASMDDITVACWADFSNEGGSFQRLWDFGVTPVADTDPNIYMFVTPRFAGNGQPRFAIMRLEEGEINITAPENLQSGWHHIAASIDSSTMTMKLYQDGRLIAEGETTLLPSDLGVTDRNWIGRSQWEADAYYQGSIDEFRIYNRALSVAELRFLAGK